MYMQEKTKVRGGVGYNSEQDLNRLATRYGTLFAHQDFNMSILHQPQTIMQLHSKHLKLVIAEQDTEIIYGVNNSPYSKYTQSAKEIQEIEKYLKMASNVPNSKLKCVLEKLLKQLPPTTNIVNGFYLEKVANDVIYKRNNRGNILQLNLRENTQTGKFTYEIIDNNRNIGFYESEPNINKFLAYTGIK